MADEHKRCPDCAEPVLAQARKCRYCGYRFDRTGAASNGSLAGLLRRPVSTATLPELLAEWGSELALDERVDYFGYCKLDAIYGFLLVTSARVAFFAGRGERRLIDWPRGEIRAVDAARRLGGTRLRVTGPDRHVTLWRFDSRQALADVVRELGG